MKVTDFCCYYCASTQGMTAATFTDIFGDDHKLALCSACGTYNLHPRPTAEQLYRAYAADYYGEGEKKFNPIIEGLLLRSKRRKAKLLASLAKGGKVLDIGCADGSTLSQFTHFGQFTLEGTELDTKASERARENHDITLHIGFLRDLQLEDRAYSVIMLNHVFEHVDDPKFTLEKAAALLKPGGALLIGQPNIESLQFKWFKGDWFHLDPPRHLNFMTRGQLINALKPLGLELVAERHHHFEFNVIGFQQSLLNRISTHRDLLYESLKGNAIEGAGIKPLLHKLFVAASFPFFFLLTMYTAATKQSAAMELVFQKQK